MSKPNDHEAMVPTGYPPTMATNRHRSNHYYNNNHDNNNNQLSYNTMQQVALPQQYHHHHNAAAASLMALPVGGPPAPPPAAVKAKRMCRFPGCTKVIKSQGHCQRHGAKAKRCRVDGCDKQAQGTHDGMCKRHWKAHNFPEEAAAAPEPEVIDPVGESAYDSLLPRSIAYRPVLATPTSGSGDDGDASSSLTAPKTLMPLVAALKEGAETKEVGWHRNAERAARGLPPVENISNHMEAWEKQLALIEILLLSGGTPHANFRHLAHAWGRERGFHHVLINTICERRGEVDRKRRSDAREFNMAATSNNKPAALANHKRARMSSDDDNHALLKAAGILDDEEEEDESPLQQRKKSAQV